MAQMNLQMTLNLADLASGPLRSVVGLIEQLSKVANGVRPKLEGIAGGITAVDKAAAGASSVTGFTASLTGLTTKLGEIRAASTAAASAVRTVGQRASTSASGVYGLEQAMGAAFGTMSRATAMLNTTAANLQQVGAAGRQAGQGVQAGTAAMGIGLQQANNQATGLMQTLRGMGQLYAAMKIKDGFVASARSSTEYETAQARATNMAMTPAERDAIKAASVATTKAVPQFDRLQTYEMAVDLRGAMNSVEGAIKVLTPMAQMAYNMKLATPSDKEFNPRAMLDVGKILQQRNAVTDPAKMLAESDMLLKIYTATQGRVDMNAMLGNIQQAKGGLGDNFRLEFMPIMATMIEQSRSNGGSGGTIGTQLTSMQRYVMGNVANGMSAKEAKRLGLIENDVVWNSQGNIDLKKSDLRMKGAAAFQNDPYEWVKKYLLPALERAGVDPRNQDAVNMTLSRLFPNRNAADIASVMSTKGRVLEADASITNRTLGNAGQTANNDDLSQKKWDTLTGKVRDFAILVGDKLQPVLKIVGGVMSTMLDGVAGFFTKFPTAATFLTWVTALGAVGLAARGFANTFGILGTFTSMLRGVGTAATGASAATTASTAATAAATTSRFGAIGAAFKVFGSDVAAGAATLGRGFLKMLPFVGLLAAAWDLAPLIGNLEIGGKKVSAWAEQLLGGVVSMFKSAWKTIGEVVSSVIPSAQAAPKVDGARRGGTSGEAGAARGAALRAEYEAAGLPDPDKPKPIVPFAGGWRGRDSQDRAKKYAAPVVADADFVAGAAAGGGGKVKDKVEFIAIPEGWVRVEDYQATLRDLGNQAREMAAGEGAGWDEIGTHSTILNTLNEDARAATGPDGLPAIRDPQAQHKNDFLRSEKDAYGLPANEGDAAKAPAALNEFSKALRDLGAGMRQTAQYGLGDMFSSVLRGAESGGKAIERFGQNLKNTFIDLIGKRLGDALMNSLFGAAGGAGGMGGGLFGLVSGWLGGGAGVAAKAPSLAVGTDRVPRDMLAMIHRGERVMPAKDNAAFTAAAAMAGRNQGQQQPTRVVLEASEGIMNMRFGDLVDAYAMREMATR